MIGALIAAGGKSSRMGCNKLKLKIGGKTVLQKTLEAFDTCHMVDSIILCTDDDELINTAKTVVNKTLIIAPGGEQRQYSVRNGLQFVDDDDIVLIHDGARPYVTQELIVRCIDSAKEYGSGVAAIPVYDSLKRADEHMIVSESIDRDGVYAMQTPQCFQGRLIKQAHRQDAFGTDDAFLVEKLDREVHLVMGDKNNIKLTTVNDLPTKAYRVGQGYDVHQLVPGRKLILCGIDVPFELGLLGHSDADVATHALMDAMLGAIGEHDIGRMFPDTDKALEGASSIELLVKVNDLVKSKGYIVSNCDVTIVAQRPKLLSFIDDMRASLAAALDIDKADVNVKATTTETLGFEGEGLGITAMAVVMLRGV